jgi:hypothetical protein
LLVLEACVWREVEVVGDGDVSRLGPNCICICICGHLPFTK